MSNQELKIALWEPLKTSTLTLLDWPTASFSSALWHVTPPLSFPSQVPHYQMAMLRSKIRSVCLKFTARNWRMRQLNSGLWVTGENRAGKIPFTSFMIRSQTDSSGWGMQSPRVPWPTQACMAYSNWTGAYLPIHERLPLGSHRHQANEIRDSAPSPSHYLQHALISGT